MPRTDTVGALHHRIVRGIERQAIFRDDQDRHLFLECLGRVLVETATPCYAWSMLSDHVHLLLVTGRFPSPRSCGGC